VRTLFYVVGREDTPLFTGFLPFCPSRGLHVRLRDRAWRVEDVELRPEHSLLVVWVVPVGEW
jgi:hypothetical protein